MKTVVVFQGGGALGAFGGGVWRRLVPWMRERGDTLVALAGASIGAINAAVAAQHLDDADAGFDALDTLWRERIATPSYPFFGWSFGDSDAAQRLRSWNGFMSGLLLGNRGLYAPQFGHWTPWHGLQRLERPLFDRLRMHELLLEEAPAYATARGDDRPLLVVAATELMRGELHLFDSDTAPLEPEHLLASTAIPLLFEPVRIDGGLYWDGEMARRSMLRPLIDRVRASGRVRPREPLQLVTIEQLPQTLDELPRSGAEITYRVLNLLQTAKLAEPELSETPGIHWLRMARAPLPHDAISGQFDYSPERVASLVAQGEAVAREVLGDAAALALPAPPQARRREPPAPVTHTDNP